MVDDRVNSSVQASSKLEVSVWRVAGGGCADIREKRTYACLFTPFRAEGDVTRTKIQNVTGRSASKSDLRDHIYCSCSLFTLSNSNHFHHA